MEEGALVQPLQTTSQLKGILKSYYQEFFPSHPASATIGAHGAADTAKAGGPKVAWCTSVGPSEILTALGFKVYFPENHGAMLGATRESNKFIPVANAQGYSPDICSYLTADIGSFLKAETPLTKAYGIPGIPKPDLLVYNTNQCREVQDWFAWYGRHFNCDMYGINSPWKIGTLAAQQIDYVETQFTELIPVAERISGNKFDIDRLREVVNLSRDCSLEWKKFLETARNAPAPISFFDGCIQMAPAVMLRGTPAAVDYYKALNAEVSERVKNKVGAVPKESVRLYWDGMPIWGKLRYFSDLFAGLNANAVASTYCNSWIFDCFNGNSADPDDIRGPIRSLAEGYTRIFINRSEAAKEVEMTRLLKEYAVDGVIYHDAKTCPYNSNSRFGMPDRLSQATGIPNLVLNGDLCDLRCFSEEQTTTSVETFIEQILESR